MDPIPGSRLVNLHFRAYDPQVAADAVNALAQLYIEQSLELRFTTSTEATGWLSDRLKEQQAKVEAAEKALQEYREREGLVNQEERQGLVEQKLEMLNGAVLDARTDRIAKESLYNQIAAHGPGQIESFPLVLGERARAGAEGRARAPPEGGGAARRHARATATPTWSACAADPLDRRRRSAPRCATWPARRRASTAPRSPRRRASPRASRRSSARPRTRTARRSSTASCKREVETNRQLYQDLLTKTKQTGLETELKTTNIRVVEKAETPRGPISPNRMRNYQVALILGLARRRSASPSASSTSTTRSRRRTT